jgi:MFS transporter, MHS family, proline/betaine transporter
LLEGLRMEPQRPSLLPFSPPRPRQSALRTALAGVIGNVLEWFDFAVYGFFVSAIGAQFFPSANPVARQLYAFAGFAVGFVGRPVGSLVLGLVGDRIGRRALLTLSVAMMGAATFVLGLLPTYDEIGIAAPILLVALRLLQGFSVGGEFTGSMVYTTELASPFWRGLVSSSTAAGTTLGIMLGNVAALAVTSTLSHEDAVAWGWRIPFVGSALLCAVGLLLRRGLDESAEGRQAAARRPPVWASLVADRLAMLRTFGIVAMTNAGYYLVFTFAAERRAAHGGGTAYWAANLLGLAVLLVAKPLGGWLSDLVGRRRLAMALNVVGMVAIFVALPALLDGSPFDFWAAQVLLAVPLGMALGLQGAMLVEIFPLRTRVTSMSFAYGLSGALAGATAPLVSTWLIDVVGQPTAPAYYIFLFGAIGLALMWPMRETNNRRLDL